MAPLIFSNQGRAQKGPGGWLVVVALLILCVLLITTSMSVGNTGVYAAVRTGVQTAAAPLQQVCSVISSPFRSLGAGTTNSYSDEEVASLQEENEQLRVLVAQLEEYRQQDQRLTTLLTLSDTYSLATVSAQVLSSTSGWNQTATLNVGSDAGVQVGQGVMSSCGLYGQVISVTSNSSVVRLVCDAESSVSAMVQGTRSTGILSGSYDGTLTLDYISVDETVGEGDVILTSGTGGTYPRGIVIGTVSDVEVDSSKLYYRITVEPLYDISYCEEALVLTGNEDETASLVDEDLLASIVAAQASNGTTGTTTTDSSNTTTGDNTTSGDTGSTETTKSDGTTSKETKSDDTTSGDTTSGSGKEG